MTCRPPRLVRRLDRADSRGDECARAASEDEDLLHRRVVRLPRLAYAVKITDP
jgi:hypothetical protein